MVKLPSCTGARQQYADNNTSSLVSHKHITKAVFQEKYRQILKEPPRRNRFQKYDGSLPTVQADPTVIRSTPQSTKPAEFHNARAYVNFTADARAAEHTLRATHAHQTCVSQTKMYVSKHLAAFLWHCNHFWLFGRVAFGQMPLFVSYLSLFVLFWTKLKHTHNLQQSVEWIFTIFNR